MFKIVSLYAIAKIIHKKIAQQEKQRKIFDI